MFGNLTSESKAIDGHTHVTSYTYDAADLVESITYPSGRTVDYTRNALGQITAVDTTYAAATTTVADDVAYEPFGPLSSLNFGNSLVMSRTFDPQYRLTAQTTGAVQDLGLTLDAAGNVDAIADGVHASLDQTFTQDPLHRIDSEAGAYGSNDYTYDENGNRLTRVHTSGGVTTQTLTYASNSNRLATHDGLTVSLDAAGNTTADPAESVAFTYDDRNRMVAAYVGAVLKASYVYNGQGQRVKKVEATGAQRTVVYHYGLDGEMLGETVYSSGGAKIGERDYLWLDELPIAQSERTFSGGTVTSSQFVYIHGDQLNTPRLATNDAGTVVWRWDSDAFGSGAADTDPDSDTNIVNVRLRFPGQYLDEETGLAYNYFRDYDSVRGRYVESDPIGLGGGVSTYGYAGANPANLIDPLGLFITSVDAACLRDPSFCAEIMGQIVQNAAAISGDPCRVEDAAQAAERFRAVGIVASVASLRGMSGAVRNGATAARGTVAARGTSVLGHHPGYVEYAESIGARYFKTIPREVVERMGPAELRAANTRFLDRLITRGDIVELSTPAAQARAGSTFAWELQYLQSQGYRLAADGMRMLPPGL